MIKESFFWLKSTFISKESVLEVTIVILAFSIAEGCAQFNSVFFSGEGFFSSPIMAVLINIILITAIFWLLGFRLVENKWKWPKYYPLQGPMRLSIILIFAVFVPIENTINTESTLLELTILPLIIIVFIFFQLQIERCIKNTRQGSLFGQVLNTAFVVMYCIPLFATITLYVLPETNIASIESYEVYTLSKFFLTEYIGEII